MLIVAVLGTAWAVRDVMVGGQSHLSDAQARMVMALAQFPESVTTALKEAQAWIGDSPRPLLIRRNGIEQPSWVRRFPAPEDPGYLLFSGVDRASKRSAVQLIRLSDGAIVARWAPDWPGIFARQTSKKYAPSGSWRALQAGHPVLLNDGDIIFNTGGSMVRLSTCSAEPVWMLDELMHHSNELDANGAAIWTPSVSEDGLHDNAWLRDRVRDDALARVSTEGRMLDRLSFARILRDNGLQALLLGMFGPRLNEDPIHLNEIQVARLDSQYWQRGDLLISARHLSTIFLYRPSTGKILWHQTGPWMNQHSVEFVDNHRISVFDNNVVSSVPRAHAFVAPGDTNRVFLFNFQTGQAAQPFAALLAAERPVTITGGRARVLPDGGLFIEETNYGRHLRFTQDRLLWSRINDYDRQFIGSVADSRYLTAEEASVPLRALTSLHCQTTK